MYLVKFMRDKHCLACTFIAAMIHEVPYPNFYPTDHKNPYDKKANNFKMIAYFLFYLKKIINSNLVISSHDLESVAMAGTIYGWYLIDTKIILKTAYLCILFERE